MVLYIGIDFIVHALIYVALRNTIVESSKNTKRTRTETHKKKNIVLSFVLFKEHVFQHFDLFF